MLFLVISSFEWSFSQTNQTGILDSPIVRDPTTSSSEKIHPILIGWQNSDNPEEFAQKYNLFYKDGKVVVYIYLKSPKSESEIPSDIEVVSSSKNIIRAFVSSDQLYELEQLDFVTRITPPELAQTPPIPKVEIPQDHTQENDYSNLWLIIPIVLVMATIIVIKTTRTKH